MNDKDEYRGAGLAQYTDLQPDETNVIKEAIGILESRMRTADVFNRVDQSAQFCQLQLAAEKEECFGVLFLDSQQRLIAFEPLFRGTIDGAAVYPRVVVRRAIELNASAVILTHNHPSGITNPSDADKRITGRIQEALSLIDVRLLDHIIVGYAGTTSLAAVGLL